MTGRTPEELAEFARLASILAELVSGRASLARLAVRHGLPREVLIRDLHDHLGQCISAVGAAAVERATVVDEPSEPPAPPVRMRKRQGPPAAHVPTGYARRA